MVQGAKKLDILAERGKRVWIRRVLVPGLTDGEDDLLRTGGFIRSLGNVERVEVLAYHDFGVAKWNALGLDYELKGIEIPAEDEIERARNLLANPKLRPKLQELPQ